MAGLRRLHTRGDFDPPSAVRIATDDYRELGDPVVALLKAEFGAERGRFVSRGAVYDAYKSFADASGIPPMGARRFYEHLPNAALAAWGVQVAEHKRNGVRGFTGLREADPDKS